MSNIWQKSHSLDELNQQAEHSLVGYLGIEMTELGDDFLKGTMPVDWKVHQPYGILHGGASVVLAETLGSLAGYMAVDDQHGCVGLEINANHLSRMTAGTLIGKATPIHIGRSTHVWSIHMATEAGKPVCVSRLTLAVISL